MSLEKTHRRRPVVRHSHVGAPHVLSSLLEGRGLLEMALLPASLPLLMEAPHGDGHPVLLLPGFMADEATLFALRTFLKSRGYDVQTWGLGRNIGFQRRHAQALEQKIRHLHHSTGRRVSLVGWSLGGVFALYGALQAPECVRQLVTLGSPVNVGPEGSQASPLVKALYRMVAHPLGAEVHVMQPRAKQLREHLLPNVPMSCLYSISDGVVPPQEATVDGPHQRCENIRVAGSHTGLGFNAMVMCIVADRLAQPEDQWRPFDRQGLRGFRRIAADHQDQRQRGPRQPDGDDGGRRTDAAVRSPERAPDQGVRRGTRAQHGLRPRRRCPCCRRAPWFLPPVRPSRRSRCRWPGTRGSNPMRRSTSSSPPRTMTRP